MASASFKRKSWEFFIPVALKSSETENCRYNLLNNSQLSAVYVIGVGVLSTATTTSIAT